MLIKLAIGIVLGGLSYRLRGGLFSEMSRYFGWEWGGKQRTQTMRAIWGVSTAIFIALVWTSPWWIPVSMALTLFASMAALGHGAHMVYNIEDLRKEHWEGGGNDLELTTLWLPWAFGGKPDATWDEQRVFLFHMTGMSFIGVLRHAIAALPLFFYAPVAAGIYVATGLLHGPLYRLGFFTPWKGAAAEVIVGSVTWVTIVLLGGLV